MSTDQDLIQRNFRISKNLDSQLNAVAKEQGITKTEVVQQSLELGLERLKELKNNSSTATTGVDLQTYKPCNSTSCAMELQPQLDIITEHASPTADLLRQLLDVQSQTQLTILSITEYLRQILDVLQPQAQVMTSLHAQLPLPAAIEDSSLIVPTGSSTQKLGEVPSTKPTHGKASSDKQTLKTQPPDIEDMRPRCPDCGSTNLGKNGFRNGKQRYKCKNCYKECSESTVLRVATATHVTESS